MAEIKNWQEQAESDLKDARLLWENHRHGAAILFYQQAVEKILKAYIIFSKKETPSKTHRIEDLMKTAELNGDELKAETKVEELSKAYIRVRYPDLNRQYYRKRERAEPMVKLGEKVYQWVKSKFKSH
ncbi:HEPN domain-containing protein [Candidatus Gottesmanbacteria bacterium]|nr:HEPN domain-containing protein [Candidatus Gottesmanbacteria bacterium]